MHSNILLYYVTLNMVFIDSLRKIDLLFIQIFYKTMYIICILFEINFVRLIAKFECSRIVNNCEFYHKVVTKVSSYKLQLKLNSFVFNCIVTISCGNTHIV